MAKPSAKSKKLSKASVKAPKASKISPAEAKSAKSSNKEKQSAAAVKKQRLIKTVGKVVKKVKEEEQAKDRPLTMKKKQESAVREPEKKSSVSKIKDLKPQKGSASQKSGVSPRASRPLPSVAAESVVSKQAATKKHPTEGKGDKRSEAGKPHQGRKLSPTEFKLIQSRLAAAGVKIPDGASNFIIKQAERLLALRDHFLDAIDAVSRDSLRSRPEGNEASAFGMHQADAGSDAYDRDFALNLLSQEQDALYEIQEALKRIETGTYGICEMSGKPIPHERLEALPFARYTVECQTQFERDRQFQHVTQTAAPLFGAIEDEFADVDDEDSLADPKE